MPPSERPLTRYLNYRARNDGIPLSGTFELSPVCNLACRMCYVRRSSAEVAAHPRPIMTLEQWKCLGDEIFDAGTLFLLLTGGEPFLWPDFRELYEYLHRKGFLISVNSNGTLISDDTVGWQVRCQAGRATFWITWDGYMTPCGMMPEPKADVAAEGFQKAWAHTMQNPKNMQLSSVCEGCKDKFLCHCCASMAIAETGRPSGIPTYLCRMSQALYSMACRELEQLPAAP
ncbi:MAG: radical SAM protein [Clostridiales bacterium]|nr:radical SAM protein [Clostridiales bacterium]